MGASQNFFEKKRHWSEFKDKMLGWYLKPYINKLLSINKPLYIVDCFAGKGKFDDNSIGSPLIIANEVKNILNDDDRYNKKINAIFIENKYGKYLENNLDGYEKCHVRNKDFEECIEGICKIANRGNVFLYIDPYGIKNLKFDFIDKICKTSQIAHNSLEMFINFSSIGFIREGCRLLKCNDFFKNEINLDDDDYEAQDVSIENMNRIFNGQTWQRLIKDFYFRKYSFYELEEKITNEYMKNFKSKFKYCLNIPIRTKQKNTPKYRMIFCTNNDEGLILMNKNMNETLQHMKKEEANGQISIFDLPEYKVNFIDLDGCILNLINDYIKINYKNFICKVIMEINIKYCEEDIRERLKFMEKQDKIHIDRKPINGYEPVRKLTGWNTKKYDIIICKTQSFLYDRGI